jgi:hypothetical protein
MPRQISSAIDELAIAFYFGIQFSQEAPRRPAGAGKLWNTIRTVLILGAAARELGGSQLYRSNETARL